MFSLSRQRENRFVRIDFISLQLWDTNSVPYVSTFHTTRRICHLLSCRLAHFCSFSNFTYFDARHTRRRVRALSNSCNVTDILFMLRFRTEIREEYFAGPADVDIFEKKDVQPSSCGNKRRHCKHSQTMSDRPSLLNLPILSNWILKRTVIWYKSRRHFSSSEKSNTQACTQTRSRELRHLAHFEGTQEQWSKRRQPG